MSTTSKMASEKVMLAWRRYLYFLTVDDEKQHPVVCSWRPLKFIDKTAPANWGKGVWIRSMGLLPILQGIRSGCVGS
jgi:hypothetical protein